MRLNHNLASLNIYREHIKVFDNQSKALERISSGYKINSAKDNPNAMASSERMRMQIRGLQIAQRNAQDGVSMLQTADGGLDSVTGMLQRIRELTVQAGSGSNTPSDMENIQMEINEMIEGMDSIVANTEFNGVSVLNPEENPSVSYDNNHPAKKLIMTIGANAGEKVEIPLYDISSNNLTDGTNSLRQLNTNVNPGDGVGGLGIDKAITIIDKAMETILSIRSKYGALSNRFESTYDKVAEIHDRITGAESKIRDADIAEEMMEFAKNNVLVDSGHAMMVQSNKFPQDILRILENVRSR
ncbi:flagellin N-terminal helical domain-containing protein [Clostridium sp. ZS2-4]|uniref:flagellin N-terminal helical domain-containing protein n=1 Tax=Clostridium sp. ZS2-4 TaxID=2987703 RepID=UPI00227D08D0|nr:flagellin [Clostridium sp. ZS2-4]MCY6353996.1 flagellin [Clostridium sp. ZS2-4]